MVYLSAIFAAIGLMLLVPTFAAEKEGDRAAYAFFVAVCLLASTLLALHVD